MKFLQIVAVVALVAFCEAKPAPQQRIYLVEQPAVPAPPQNQPIEVYYVRSQQSLSPNGFAVPQQNNLQSLLGGQTALPQNALPLSFGNQLGSPSVIPLSAFPSSTGNQFGNAAPLSFAQSPANPAPQAALPFFG